MELPIALQARQFLLAGGLGLALGVLYDLLRALRRARPRTGPLWDLVFGFLLTPSLALFALYAGRGAFRLFFLPGAALGLLLYFSALSGIFLPFFERLLRLLGRFFSVLTAPARFFYKKTRFLLKNLFSSAGKWVKIVVRQKQSVRSRSRASGGTPNEIQEIVIDPETDRFGTGGVRRRYPGLAPVADQGQARRIGSPLSKNIQRSAGKRPPAGRSR